MRLGLLRESAPQEKRVALVPAGVEALVRGGADVLVERDAGSGYDLDDDAYARVGATIVDPGDAGAAEVVVSVRDLPADFPARPGDTGSPLVFVGVFDPLWMPQRAQRHASDGTTAFSMDLVPRITRAQTMDVLSSMGTIAGYEAVLMAASRLPQMFPLMMTAAGTLAPARVLVLGAGVAGLQAIATSRRLGAVVQGYDVRPAAVEQIRSMGARAVELDGSEAGTDGSDTRTTAATHGHRPTMRRAASASCSPPMSPGPTWSSPPQPYRAGLPRCSSQPRWSTPWPRDPLSSTWRRSAAATAL